MSTVSLISGLVLVYRDTYVHGRRQILKPVRVDSNCVCVVNNVFDPKSQFVENVVRVRQIGISVVLVWSFTICGEGPPSFHSFATLDAIQKRAIKLIGDPGGPN